MKNTKRYLLAYWIGAAVLQWSHPSFGQDNQAEEHYIEAKRAFEDRNYTRSYELFSRLAEKGVGSAHYNKGLHQLNGLGVAKNLNGAVESFMSAAQLGVVEAKTQVGIMYMDGQGVSKNIPKATEWLQEAINGGSYEAQYMLAKLYLRAEGIPKDEQKSTALIQGLAKNKKDTQDWRRAVSNSVELYKRTRNITRGTALTELGITETDLASNTPSDIESRGEQDAKLSALRKDVERLGKEKEEAERRAKEAATSYATELAEARARKTESGDNSKKQMVHQYLNVHAFVVGISDYNGSARLKNPANDAAAISKKLRAFGFNVEEYKNISRAELVTALSKFSRTAEEADLTIFFFAGHGLQVFGTNYLLPKDVDLSDPRSATLQAISMNSLMEQYLPGKSRLIFLDACRDNPLANSNSRGITRGLAPSAAVEGTLIAYATKDGGIALDGDGDSNSPFTKALLTNLDRDEDIAVLLRKVRQDVINSTANKQMPWEYGSLMGDSIILSRIKPRIQEQSK